MHRTIRLAASIFGAGLLVLAVAGGALGYAGQVATTVTVNGPSGPQYCGLPLRITVQLLDKDGHPVTDATVTWVLGAGSGPGDLVDPISSVTNAQGEAVTFLTLHCSESRAVTLQAQAGDANGSVVIQSSGQGLPPTSTLAAEAELPGVLLAALAVLGGAGTMLRRFAAARR